jgi:hypothetical protein
VKSVTQAVGQQRFIHGTDLPDATTV